MTNTQLRKALRFLFRLQKLTCKGLELKNGIYVHLEANRLTEVQISHYRAFLQDNELVIEELPVIDERQLEFEEVKKCSS